MKYLYKQLLAFLTVVLITTSVIGIFFTRFAISSIYDQKEEQLFGYAESVIDFNMTVSEVEEGMRFISNQDVLLALYNSQDQLVYPENNPQYASGLSPQDLAKLQNGERISLTRRERNFMNENQSIVTVYLPLFNRVTGGFSGFVAVASPISGIESDIHSIEKNLLITVLLSGALSVLISIGFANYLSRRIVRMQEATRAITSGNFDVRVEQLNRDEFDELAEDFNKMALSLKQSHEEINRQENLRRQFMMDVAHEMRTPLTTINGILEGLLHDMIPEKSRKRSLDLMQKETRRMIRMVNENLDYEKIRSNQIQLVKQEFSAKEALFSVKEQLQQKAASKGNTIHVAMSSPHIKVYADYDRFIQILVNLTTNAIQFTQNGEIALVAREEDGYTVIQVSDTGIGIEEKDIQDIWERFYKADISRKNNKFGESGIGLAIVKSLVNSHGGTIEVKSRPGEGTTFTFRLPTKQSAQAAETGVEKLN